MARVRYSAQSLANAKRNTNLQTRLPPAMKIEARFDDPASALVKFISNFDGRVLFTCEGAGRSMPSMKDKSCRVVPDAMTTSA